MHDGSAPDHPAEYRSSAAGTVLAAVSLAFVLIAVLSSPLTDDEAA